MVSIFAKKLDELMGQDRNKTFNMDYSKIDLND